jgi:hypothetical protein
MRLMNRDLISRVQHLQLKVAKYENERAGKSESGSSLVPVRPLRKGGGNRDVDYEMDGDPLSDADPVSHLCTLTRTLKVSYLSLDEGMRP